MSRPRGAVRRLLQLRGGALRYHPAPRVAVDLADLLLVLRKRIFRRLLRLGLCRSGPRGDDGVAEQRIFPARWDAHRGGDRAALQRLLLYFLRPALSLKQLTYKPEKDLFAIKFSRLTAAIIP